MQVQTIWAFDIRSISNCSFTIHFHIHNCAVRSVDRRRRAHCSLLSCTDKCEAYYAVSTPWLLLKICALLAPIHPLHARCTMHDAHLAKTCRMHTRMPIARALALISRNSILFSIQMARSKPSSSCVCLGTSRQQVVNIKEITLYNQFAWNFQTM